MLERVKWWIDFGIKQLSIAVMSLILVKKVIEMQEKKTEEKKPEKSD